MWLQEYWQAILLFFSKYWAQPVDPEYASIPPVFHLDDYDNCMLYGDSAFYCHASLQLRPKNPENVSATWEILKKMSSKIGLYNHTFLRHGICVTKRCPNLPNSDYLVNKTDYFVKLSRCYSAAFENQGLKGAVFQTSCLSNKSPYELNSYDFLFGGAVLIVIIAVLLAWFYDILVRPDLKDKKFASTIFGKYISSFSLNQNWDRLTTINQNPSSLSCFHGVRVINVAAVIVSHGMLFNIAIPIINTYYVESIRTGFKLDQYYGLGTRYTTVQTFYLLSAWLLTYKFFKDNEGKKVEVSYLLRQLTSRYFRLTPLMAVIVIFSATWLPHLTSGPFWDPVVGPEYRICREFWWSNLFYLNNLLSFHEMCACHLWSLSVDMHYYIISLVLLWIAWKYPGTLFWLLGGVWVYHVIGTGYLFHNFKSLVMDSPELTFNTTLINLTTFLNIAKSGTTNIPGFLMGIFYGYFFYKYENKNLLDTKQRVLFWWILSWGSIAASVVVPGIFVAFWPKKLFLHLLYVCLSRTLFTFGTGCFIFGMTQGKGGIIRRLCDWPAMQILGRLSYCSYMTHTIFQRVKVGMMRTLNYLHPYLMVFDCFAYLTWIFLASVPLVLFFEMPFERIRVHISASMKPSTETGKKTEPSTETRKKTD